jgi:Putative transposase
MSPARGPFAIETERHLAPTRKIEWRVYAKPPFGGPKRPLTAPEQVLKYMARYTHRVAIANDRVLDIENDKVAFRWKDYRDNNRRKTVALTAEEFIRRFLLHILPDGFQRIRYYGFLANCCRKQKLALCRQLLEMPLPEARCQVKKDYRDRYEQLTGTSLTTCPVCHQGHMLVIEVLESRHSRRSAHAAQFTDHPPSIDTS